MSEKQQEVHPLDVIVAFTEKSFNKERISYSDLVMVNKSITELANIANKYEELIQDRQKASESVKEVNKLPTQEYED